MEHKITLGEPCKYILNHAIDGTEDLKSLLLSVDVMDYLTTEISDLTEVMSYMLWQWSIESILTFFKENPPATQKAVRLESMLKSLLVEMDKEEIDLIIIEN
jgi:Mrp family chromosome partitioning ATPase